MTKNLLLLAVFLSSCNPASSFAEMSKVDGGLMMRKDAGSVCMLMDNVGNDKATGDCMDTVSIDYYDAAMLGGLMGLSNNNVTPKDSTEISHRKIQCNEKSASCRIHQLNYSNWLYYGAHYVRNDKSLAKLVINYWKN